MSGSSCRGRGISPPVLRYASTFPRSEDVDVALSYWAGCACGNGCGAVLFARHVLDARIRIGHTTGCQWPSHSVVGARWTIQILSCWLEQ